MTDEYRDFYEHYRARQVRAVQFLESHNPCLLDHALSSQMLERNEELGDVDSVD